ncbi:response regulator [Stieleria varia]|uniref:Polar-differentiation response regulator DivK n=1 Tax=Stieleria varia TaxID=2528005 RepID=A0A5C5ZWL1_9BACT|nr:response regulator [Stieleria varia]TWT91505.1 Polar-differentiation response regulator DivK [Stieleria varia]
MTTTILVVDDHDDIRDLITQKLQRNGFTVVTAKNGLEAVLVTAQAAPALILMDINMPELDGLAATAQIRTENPAKRTPVIALTAYAMDDDETRSLAAGCDAFHRKPVDFDLLLDQISTLIAQTSSDDGTLPST